MGKHSTVQFSSAYTLTADAQFFFGEYYYYSRIRWLLVFHHCSHCTHSKWIGNKSNVGENMFCMRFDVVCFWWQKQKYCFFTTHPTHFVNRYCALVVAAAVADGAVRFVVGSFFFLRESLCLLLSVVSSKKSVLCEEANKMKWCIWSPLLFVYNIHLTSSLCCDVFLCAFDTLLHELLNF